MSELQREVRYCALAPVELREAAGDQINVTGYAAVFGEAAEIGPLDSWGWSEVVERGAFSAVMT